MRPKIWLPSLILSVVLVSPAGAQEYTPPPMFGAPGPAPIQEQPQKAQPIKPTQPSPVIEKPKPVAEKTIKAKKAPVPGRKPMRAEAKKQGEPVVEAGEEDTVDAPIPSRKPESEIAKAVVQESEKERPGVVTGPKTMPAVPAGGFDAETLYHDDDGKIEGAILKRHAETLQEEEKPAPVSVAPENADLTLLDIFELDGGQAYKIVVPFDQGMETVSDALMTSVQAKTYQLMGRDEGWRVRILAYASPYDEGLSSDRRMALNRALLFREAMLNQGIEARRIDVHALGKNTRDPQKDRVDLIYYGPEAAL